MLYIFVIAVLGLVSVWVAGMIVLELRDRPRDRHAILSLILTLAFTGGLSLGMFLLALNA